MDLSDLILYYRQEPWELLPLLISAVSLIIACASLILSRRHATRLFRVAQYPQLEFNLEMVGAFTVATDGRYSDVQGKQNLVLGYIPIIVADITNTTDVPAQSIAAEFVLMGKKKIKWREFITARLDTGEKWRRIAGVNVAYAMVQAKPDLIQVREYQDSLRDFVGPCPTVAVNHEYPASCDIPTVLYLEFSWNPPIYKPPTLTSAYRIRFDPRAFEGVLVKEWSADVRRLSHWRLVVSKVFSKMLDIDKSGEARKQD